MADQVIINSKTYVPPVVLSAEFTQDDRLKLNGIEVNADVTDTENVSNAIANATTKSSIVDADTVTISDSASSKSMKRVTFSTIKSTLKTYFDTLYNKYVHPNHSGDVTSVGDGSTTISTNVVNNAKLADVPTNTIKGRVSSATGDPEDLTPTQVRTMLNVVDGATKVQGSTTNGNVVINGTETKVYEHPSGTNPHGTTKSDVGLGNVPNVSTNNQTPTYTIASSDTNLTSGETLTTALGKIARAISSLIIHLADSVIHITSTERTNWNSAKTHADSAHAPSNAQKNSDITKAEIEAKLTGTITTHGHTVTKSDVGLGNVTNESKSTMFDSPIFTGTPTAPTATAGTSNTQIATTEFVQSAMSSAGAGDMLKSVYDTNGDGIVNNSDMLDGKHASDFEPYQTIPSYSRQESDLPKSYPMGSSIMFVRSNEGWFSFGTVVTHRGYSEGGSTYQIYTPYSPNYGGRVQKIRFGNYDVNAGNSWTDWYDNFHSGSDMTTTKKLIFSGYDYVNGQVRLEFKPSGFENDQSVTVSHEISDGKLPQAGQGIVFASVNPTSHPVHLVTDGELFAKGNQKAWHQGNMPYAGASDTAYTTQKVRNSYFSPTIPTTLASGSVCYVHE